MGLMELLSDITKQGTYARRVKSLPQPSHPLNLGAFFARHLRGNTKTVGKTRRFFGDMPPGVDGPRDGAKTKDSNPCRLNAGWLLAWRSSAIAATCGRRCGVCSCMRPRAANSGGLHFLSLHASGSDPTPFAWQENVFARSALRVAIGGKKARVRIPEMGRLAMRGSNTDDGRVGRMAGGITWHMSPANCQPPTEQGGRCNTSYFQRGPSLVALDINACVSIH